MKNRIHVRDLLTDDGYPLHPDEWNTRSQVRDDGSLLVQVFGPATQVQALEILADYGYPAEAYLDSYVIVRDPEPNR